MTPKNHRSVALLLLAGLTLAAPCPGIGQALPLHLSRAWGLSGEHADTLLMESTNLMMYMAHDFSGRTGTWSALVPTRASLALLDSLMLLLRAERTLDSARFPQGAVRTCHGLVANYQFGHSGKRERFDRCSVTFHDSVDVLVERLLASTLDLP
jgi:hypothetical protein